MAVIKEELKKSVNTNNFDIEFNAITLRFSNKLTAASAIIGCLFPTACVSPKNQTDDGLAATEQIANSASNTRDFLIATIDDHQPYPQFATPPGISLTCLAVPDEPYTTVCHATEDPLAQDTEWILKMSGLQWAVWTIDLETGQPRPFPNETSAMFCRQIEYRKLKDCTPFSAPEGFNVYTDNGGI